MAEDNKKFTYNVSTPYHTVVNHLKYLQDDTYHPEIASKSFDDTGLTKEDVQNLAIKLKQVLDGKGLYIEVDDIPKQKLYIDSANNRFRYVLAEELPEVYLEKKGNQWLYSKRTNRAIIELHKDVYPYGTDKLLTLLPKSGNKKVMGLYVWQHIGILVIVVLSFLIHKILSFFFHRLLLGYIKKQGYKEIADKFIKPVTRPISIFFVCLLLIVFVPVLQLPITIAKYTIMAIKAALPFFSTMVFYYLVDILCFYLERLASKTESTLDDQLVPLLRKSLKTFVVITGGLFILTNLNIPVLPLLTGLSIGGLAFALAAQDTIKNFFGSLMIFVDKPFQIGDWITSEDLDGTVEEVGFRSTRIRTFRNSVTSIPNGKLADKQIDNHGQRRYRRFYTRISINYDTPTELIETFVEGLNRIVENHPKTRKDYFEVHLNEMSTSALEIMFYIFFEVPSWSVELRARHEVLLQIIRLAEELGVNFAFPTQTLHIENLPGKDSLSTVYESDVNVMKKKMDQQIKGKYNYQFKSRIPGYEKDQE